jgi:hypothetical protein
VCLGSLGQLLSSLDLLKGLEGLTPIQDTSLDWGTDVSPLDLLKGLTPIQDTSLDWGMLAYHHPRE